MFSAILQELQTSRFLSTSTVCVLCHPPRTPAQSVPLYFNSLRSLPSSKNSSPVGSSLLQQSVFSAVLQELQPSQFLSTSTVCVLCHPPRTPAQSVPLYFNSLCSLPSSKNSSPVGSSLLQQYAFSAILQDFNSSPVGSSLLHSLRSLPSSKNSSPVGSSLLQQSAFSAILQELQPSRFLSTSTVCVLCQPPRTPAQSVPLYFNSLCSLPTSKNSSQVGSSLLQQFAFFANLQELQPSQFLSTSTVCVLCHPPRTPAQSVPLYFNSLRSLPTSKNSSPVSSSLLQQSALSANFQELQPSQFLSTSTVCVLCHPPRTPAQSVPLYFNSLCSLPSSKNSSPVGSSLLQQSAFSANLQELQPSQFLSTSTVCVLCKPPRTPAKSVPLYFNSLRSLPTSKNSSPVSSSLLQQSVFSAILQELQPSQFLSTSTVCVLCQPPRTPAQSVPLYFNSLRYLPTSKNSSPVSSSLLQQSAFSAILQELQPSQFLSTSTVCVLCHPPRTPAQSVPLYFNSLRSLPTSKNSSPVSSSLLQQSVFSANLQELQPSRFLSTSTVCVLCQPPRTPAQSVPLYFNSLRSLPYSKNSSPVSSSLLQQSAFSANLQELQPSQFLSTSTVCVLCQPPRTPAQSVPLYFNSLCSLPSSKNSSPVGSSLLQQSVFSANLQELQPSQFLSTSTVCVLCQPPRTPAQSVPLYFNSLRSLPTSKNSSPVSSSLLQQSAFSAILQELQPSRFLSTSTVCVLCHPPRTPAQSVPLYFNSLRSLPTSKNSSPVSSSLLQQSAFSAILQELQPSRFLSTSTVCVLCHPPRTPAQSVPLYFNSMRSLPSSKNYSPVGSSLLQQSAFSAILQELQPSRFLSTSTVCVLCHPPRTTAQSVPLYFNSLRSLPSSKNSSPVGSSLLQQSAFSAILQELQPSQFLSTSTVCVLCHPPRTPAQSVPLYFNSLCSLPTSKNSSQVGSSLLQQSAFSANLQELQPSRFLSTSTVCVLCHPPRTPAQSVPLYFNSLRSLLTSKNSSPVSSSLLQQSAFSAILQELQPVGSSLLQQSAFSAILQELRPSRFLSTSTVLQFSVLLLAFLVSFTVSILLLMCTGIARVMQRHIICF